MKTTIRIITIKEQGEISYMKSLRDVNSSNKVSQRIVDKQVWRSITDSVTEVYSLKKTSLPAD